MKQFSTVFLENFVNYLPSTRDLKPFIEFSHHPGWVITPARLFRDGNLVRACGLQETSS